MARRRNAGHAQRQMATLRTTNTALRLDATGEAENFLCGGADSDLDRPNLDPKPGFQSCMATSSEAGSGEDDIAVSCRAMPL